MSAWVGSGWKMNKTRVEALDWTDAVADRLPGGVPHGVRAFVLPPFTCLRDVAERLDGTGVAVGAQNVHWDDAGAWTGEISGPMLRDCGATMVEIGHSERRAHFGETDATVARRVEAALRHGLTPLVCVGETAAERDAGRADAVLERQTRAALAPARGGGAEVVVAYEPVWAIGLGGTPAGPGLMAMRACKPIIVRNAPSVMTSPGGAAPARRGSGPSPDRPCASSTGSAAAPPRAR